MMLEGVERACGTLQSTEHTNNIIYNIAEVQSMLCFFREAMKVVFCATCLFLIK